MDLAGPQRGAITNSNLLAIAGFIALSILGILVGRFLLEPSESREFTDDGQELEHIRNLSEFEAIDQLTLMLRKKQPIYYLGVPMRQIPTDNWLLGELIHILQPDYIIETGTLNGGSALYYAAQLRFVSPDAKIISIDINEDQIDPIAKAHPLWEERVIFIKGSSTSPDVIEKVRAEVGNGKKILVTLDTLHAPNHVSKERELYSEFVSKGSFMILQDTFYEGLPEVLDEFLAANEGWTRNKGLDDRFSFTKYRGGFLERQN